MRRLAISLGWLVWAAAGVLAQEVAIDRAAWLQGCWRSIAGQTTIDEQWMAPSGGSMLGMGRTVRGGLLADWEFLLLRVQDGSLAYEAHPAKQAPATFLATTATEATLVFENAAHDFPQRIGYRRDGADRLQAWLEGTTDGRSRRVEFSFQRVPCAAP